MIHLALLTLFNHGPVLATHAILGSVVLLLAVAAIVVRWARRAVLYGLAVQIAVGAFVAGYLRLSAPIPHVLLALLAGGVYSGANAAERAGRSPLEIRGLLALALVIIALVYYIGEHGLR